jgi:hypothetical protein
MTIASPPWLTLMQEIVHQSGSITYPRDLLWLLRRGGKANRKEHSAKRKTEELFVHEGFLLIGAAAWSGDYTLRKLLMPTCATITTGNFFAKV